MPKLKLHWQIAIGLGLAVLVGSLVPPDAGVFGVTALSLVELVGSLFLRALKMLVVPLIAASIIAAVAGMGGTERLGKLGVKTVAYYLLTSTLAILAGLVLVATIRPGIVDGEPAKDLIGLSSDTESVTQRVAGRTGKDVVEVVLRLVPENVLKDAAEGEMLGVIFFSILFGFMITRVPERYGGVLRDFWQGVYEVMLLITDWVMRFAPIGVFALVSKVVMTTGFSALRPLSAFFVTVVMALSIHAFVVLPLLLKFLGGVSPVRHAKAVAPALLMAFSTASSSATLPLTLDCVHKRAGVSKRVTSFTLPLGATVNMDGTALYECVAAIFIAQAYGVELGYSEQFTVVVVALLTSVGVAGIPAASLVAITLILTTIGLPLEAIGLILAVDRVLDMFRTAVNVFGDTTAAVVIGRSEGETGILTSDGGDS
ncbi:MAG: dicarboxylate/amino acid:cation symporter [Polyangiaceae bacterium]|nr:dicarboxylate/amino acid:cation symporter [Polyangiaceae bacterium]